MAEAYAAWYCFVVAHIFDIVAVMMLLVFVAAIVAAVYGLWRVGRWFFNVVKSKREAVTGAVSADFSKLENCSTYHEAKHFRDLEKLKEY